MKNVGMLSIHKGTLDNFKVKMFDAIPLCDENCPLYEELCTYDKTRRHCDLRRQYITSVFDSLSVAVKDWDEVAMLRVGMHLMPLYTMLVTFKMEAYNKQGQIRTKRGGIDPIYKEMRETIKMIDGMLKELGVSKETGGTGKGDLLNGDGDYYEMLLKGQGVPRT